MSKEYSLILFSSIFEIKKQDWVSLEDEDSPFADWEFLSCLEQGQCVGEAAGWKPIYVTFWKNHKLSAATILYEKNNSYGEYIFDWSWAQAALQAGIEYYPKLVSAVPFTPASCSKFLLINDLSEEEAHSLKHKLIWASKHIQREKKLQSNHFLFTNPDENNILLECDFLIRHSFQYHWRNKNYKDFDQFLAELKSRKAKNIRKERERISAYRIEKLTGDSLSAREGSEFYHFYLNTIHAKGAIAYLTQHFFESVFEKMKDRILLLKAFDDDVCIAQALYFFKGQKIYGRYWGCKQETDFLHFELCYYQGIEFAIEKTLSIFEAGAQGEHKVSRGFLPSLTYSAHDFEHQEMKKAVANFLEQEKSSIKKTFNYLEELSPYHQLSK